MPRRFAILQFSKIMHASALAATECHNRRIKPPANADPSRSPLNVDLMPSHQQHLTFNERTERRLTELGIRHHRREVLALELILGMSEEAQTHVPLDQWQARSFAAARQIAQPENIIGANVHYDEKTPHLHVVFLPIKEVVRKQRGPSPKSGCRKQRTLHVLSFAAFAGGNKREVSKTVSQWHDIYAGQARPLGLERGIPGGPAQHLPQQRLYAETAEVEALAEKLLALIKDPNALFEGWRKPTAADLADPTRWNVYRDQVTGNARKVLNEAAAGFPALLELATGGLFARRAHEKLRQLDRERNEWKTRALTGENAQSQRCDAHATEVRALAQRLRAAEVPPLLAGEIAAILGLPLHPRQGRDGRRLDQIVNAAGEVLTLHGGAFVKPDGSRLSIVRFLQTELQLASSQEVYALIAAKIGDPRALATFTATFRQAYSAAPSQSPSLALPTSGARESVLQANLESCLKVSRPTTRRLLDEHLLTVNVRGDGVLLPRDGAHGYTFTLGKGGCVILGSPIDFSPVHLGDAGTWTQLITEDAGLALQVFDATQGKVASLLVPRRSLTEERLQSLKYTHRETLATPGSFLPGWDASMSAVIRPATEILPAVTEIMRSARHPIYTVGADSTSGTNRQEISWS